MWPSTADAASGEGATHPLMPLSGPLAQVGSSVRAQLSQGFARVMTRRGYPFTVPAVAANMVRLWPGWDGPSGNYTGRALVFCAVLTKKNVSS
jgi:hypothetical protein